MTWLHRVRNIRDAKSTLLIEKIPMLLMIVLMTWESCFGVVNSLTTLAMPFGDFFHNKIEFIKSNIDNISIIHSDVPFYHPQEKFKEFSAVWEDDFRRIILNSKNTTGQLDPIFTFLIELCANELAAVIAKIVNLSLCQGTMPDHWKSHWYIYYLA